MEIRELAERGMKQMNANGLAVRVLVAALVALGVSAGRAQLADKQTRDLLIQKLTHVYSTLAAADPTRTGLTLRLADLHAERARQAAMDELRDGCTTCIAGKEDRVTALRYYQEVLPKLSDSQVAKVLPQVGHLYELTGQEKLAVETYERVIREGKLPEAVGEAHLSLAEVNFKRRDFATAKKHYEKVLGIVQAGSKGLAAYRLAWCDFNSGALEPAIAGLVKILKTPELSSRSASAVVVQIDRQFQEEVSRDLATFMARRSVTIADAQVIYDLSPETVKLANLIYLANEVERLGQAKASIALWRFSQERQNKPRAKVEGHIRLAQLEMEQKNPRAAGQEFDLAMNLWPTAIGDAKDDEAKEMKARLRKVVLDWNRTEKKNPSDELANSYRIYVRTFPTEADMTVWTAQVLREKQQHQDAVSFYRRGAELYSEGLKLAQGLAQGDAKKTAYEGLENALLGAIEVGEISKDKALLVSAYDTYLKLSVDRKREIEVLYQKANIAVESADHSNAAEQMRAIAYMTSAKSPDALKVRRQAADVALDELVLLKDDERLEKWAKDFALLFPQDAAEYAKVARKSVLTQSTALAAAGTTADYDKAWAVLQRFDLASSTPEDKATYLKNRLILAEKTGRFADARDAADLLLKSPVADAVDKQYALSRKAWLSEMILDFDGALNATEQIQATKEVSEEQRLLKLAMYADLAQKDSRPYLARYMGVSKDEDKQLTIASQLVRESKDQAKELEKHKATLLKKPELYAQLALEIAAKLDKPEYAKQALAQKGVATTPAGRLLSRVVILDEIVKQKAKFAAHHLDGSTQKKLGATLKGRNSMLEGLEKVTGQAVESGDWTAQLVALDMLTKESNRFYTEILSLPVPAGLSSEDEQQYLGLLSQQAAPYQVKAQDVQKKVDEFWGNTKAVEAIESSLVGSTGALRSLVVREIKVLSAIAPEAMKAQLDQLAARPEANEAAKPALAQIETARQAVRESPLNREKLEALLQLERQAGRVAMVSYLEGRIQSLGTAQPVQMKQ